MRICLVSAGAFAHVGAYIDYFKDAGHDVRFVALSPSPPRPVPTYEVGVGMGRRSQYAVGMLRVRALIRRLRPDVVHTHYATSGGLAGLVSGYHPTVVTAHGTDLATGVRSPARRALLKAVFARADCVNPVSEELRTLALELGVDPAKVLVLTLGVDTTLFAFRPPAPLQPGRRLRLICTRRLEPVYDAATIVEALALLKREGVPCRATFAGDGPERPALERLAAARGLGADDVVFLGEVAHDSLPDLLRGHDVYLSASRRDGTSLSLLEAMSCGVFPIVSDIPANAAWLKDGVGGFFHRAGDPADLARRVAEFARAPGVAAAAARANAAVVARSGDRAKNMGKLEERYAALVAARKNSCTAAIRSTPPTAYDGLP